MDWNKTRGSLMRVKSGPFQGWEGVAQVFSGDSIELAFAGKKPTDKLWFLHDNLEPAS